MRILLVGGSGYVGSMVVPFLKPEHEIRVLDLAPPKDPSVEYRQGSVADISAIRAALAGMEGVAYMVMPRNTDGRYDVRDIDASYDLHVKNLHRVLFAAAEAKLARAVYISSGSVHGPTCGGQVPSEDTPCDAPDLYGFTKALGERVCEYFARVHHLTVISLRLWGPTPREEWQKHCRPGQANTSTAAPDVASAISLALTAPVTGFHTLSISGDYEGKHIHCARAKQVLGWEPRERPAGGQ